jgi:hypothetical protein
MPKEITVYVKLAEEGSDLWRPVNASALSDGTFELMGIDGRGLEDEVWEFPIHSRVICEEKLFPDGTTALVAIARA